MDVQILYDIPIAGILFQFLGYLLEVLPRIAPGILSGATPIALGAMCGILCERSGIVNIGIEGMMLTGAFVGFATGSIVVGLVPDGPETDVFGITIPLVAAVIAAILSGMLLSVVHAWLSITVRADQIISGTIINIIAIGVTGYLWSLVGSDLDSGGRFDKMDPPEALIDLPVIGPVFDMFLDQGPITFSLIFIVILLQVLLFRSRWGLRTRAVGEHPRAADTVGVDVIALRYRNVIVGGALAGLAGGYLTLEATGSFQTGLTAGRGFIALAAVIVGRWTPVGALLAALLFAGSDRLGIAIGLSPPEGQLGEVLGQLPDQFWAALPYILTIVVLAGVVGRSIPPAAVGRPYAKEGAD